MGTRAIDPLRLDVLAFARADGHLDGRWPVASMARLESLLARPADADDVTWQVDGEQQAAAGAEPETWLRVRADAQVELTCQRCLLPLPVALAVDRRIRFVRDEAAAEALDAQIEEDVLALDRALDLRQLLEDELLLALPLVPRHARCPEQAVLSASEPAPPATANPFAVLAALKKGDGGA
jgi:uncharacterized protein